MKLCRKCKEEKNIMEFNKSTRNKDGLQSYCKLCNKINTKKHNMDNIEINKENRKIKRLNNIEYYREKEKLNRIINADKIKEYQKKSHAKHIKRIKQYSSDYYIQNKEAINIKNAKWKELNRDKIKKRNDEYLKENQSDYNARTAKRTAHKLQATPSWLTKEQYNEIKLIYKKAKLLTIETGVIHHVDHIIPLQGKTVRGLHVPWNLQILEASENIRKGNKL